MLGKYYLVTLAQSFDTLQDAERAAVERSEEGRVVVQVARSIIVVTPICKIERDLRGEPV